MSGFEDSKQQILERSLENASLTDGLSDEDAQSLLSWCEARIAAFVPTAERTLSDYGQYLARQARAITRIARHIEDGDSHDRIRQRLQQLTDDAAQQAGFLRLLDEPWPMQDYFQALYRIAASL